MMETRNEAAWIDANVDAVENYLKNEFENFAITHHADRPLTHTFILDDGKKQFTLVIGWPILAERSFTPESIDRLLKDNVAEEMRLHGSAGYYWTPSHEDTIQRV
ncbi:MAG: hypothetical protein ACREJN_19490, partial [Nitrospiraceae bacterium]